MSNGHAGRPEIKLDWDAIDKSLKAGALGTEIAEIFGVHHDTLYNRCVKEKGMYFSDYAAKVRAKGKDIIRQKQFEKAEAGDNTMLIWVGRTLVGQKETVTHETKVSFSDLVRELDPTRPRIEVCRQPEVETGTPLLDQGCSGESCTVQT